MNARAPISPTVGRQLVEKVYRHLAESLNPSIPTRAGTVPTRASIAAEREAIAAERAAIAAERAGHSAKFIDRYAADIRRMEMSFGRDITHQQAVTIATSRLAAAKRENP